MTQNLSFDSINFTLDFLPISFLNLLLFSLNVKFIYPKLASSRGTLVFIFFIPKVKGRPHDDIK